MFLRVFESRKSKARYTIFQEVYNLDCIYIENEDHNRIHFTENEVFNILDKLFKDKQNAISEGCKSHEP
jgi:hypothetical protein